MLHGFALQRFALLSFALLLGCAGNTGDAGDALGMRRGCGDALGMPRIFWGIIPGIGGFTGDAVRMRKCAEDAEDFSGHNPPMFCTREVRTPLGRA